MSEAHASAGGAPAQVGRRSLRSRSRRRNHAGAVLVVACSLVVCSLTWADRAQAHSFAIACDSDAGAFPVEVAMCERLNAIAEHEHDEHTDVRITGVNIPPGPFDPRPAGALQVFDLSLYTATDRQSADDNETELRLGRDVTEPLALTWAGVWVLGGILLASLFSQLWHRVWGFWR